jgi:hypothetical protein
MAVPVVAVPVGVSVPEVTLAGDVTLTAHPNFGMLSGVG